MKFNFTTFVDNHSTATVGAIIGLATLGVFTITSAVGTVIINAKKKHDENIRREGYLNGYMDSTNNLLESLDTAVSHASRLIGFTDVLNEDDDKTRDQDEE